MSQQSMDGLALAAAGQRSKVPSVRRVAGQLAKLERDHPGGGRVVGAAARDDRRPADAQRFVVAATDHVDADVLVARIELREGTDRALRIAAASVIAAARSTQISGRVAADEALTARSSH